MSKKKYFDRFQEYEEDFCAFFKKDAKIYWEIYMMHYTKGHSYEFLADKYHYSESTIKRILRRVEAFLEHPEQIIRKRNYLYENVVTEFRKPDQFINGMFNLSLIGHKIFNETIAIYQYGMEPIVPCSHIIAYLPACKNVNRRIKLYNELRKLRITFRDGTVVKIYDYIVEKEQKMYFQFTEECIEYIDFMKGFRDKILREYT